MKKLLMAMTIMAIGLLGFCEGVQEGAQEARSIVFVHEGVDSLTPVDDPWFAGGWYADNLIPLFTAETGIEVEFRLYESNITERVDADIESGDPPDVVLAYASRISRLRGVTSVAVLNDRLSKVFVSKFVPAFWEPWSADGEIFAIPHVGWTAFYTVDMTVARRIGAEHLLPAADSMDRSWTIAQFNEFLELVKQKEEMYGTFLFANGAGGDYWSAYGFLAGFGAKLYDEGRIALDSPEGLKAMQYLKWLQTEGHAPKAIAALSYKELIDGWSGNKFASCGGNMGFVNDLANPGGYKNNGYIQEMADELHEAVMMEWPHDPEGVPSGHVGIMYGPDAIAILDNGDEQKIADAVRFAEYLSSKDSHYARAAKAKWSPLWQPKVRGEYTLAYKQADATMRQAGVWDMGVGLEQNSDIRDKWAVTLQYLFNDEFPPVPKGVERTGDLAEECIKYFTREGTKILNR